MAAWLAVDKDGTECIYADKKPLRGKDKWGPDSWDYRSDDAFYDFVEIPNVALKSSSEENCLGAMSLSNLNNCSL